MTIFDYYLFENNNFQNNFKQLLLLLLALHFEIVSYSLEAYGPSPPSSIDLYPSLLDILPFFLLLFFQTLTMSEHSEQLINQYIDEINLLPLPTSFESRRRTLDLCYAIRLEYTRTAASIARHKNALQSVVVLINILKDHPPSQIEE